MRTKTKPRKPPVLDSVPGDPDHLISVCLTFLCNLAMSTGLWVDLKASLDSLDSRIDFVSPGHESLMAKLRERLDRAFWKRHQLKMLLRSQNSRLAEKKEKKGTVEGNTK